MLHETISINPKLFWEKYTTVNVSGMRGRFLIRKQRLENVNKYLLCLARAYKTAQRQYEDWREKVWFPLHEQLKSFAVNDVVKFHAKPTHDYKMYKNHDWWEYTFSKSEPPYGWGYTFDWIEEPKEKLYHELGQKFYHLDEYQKKFSHRVYTLEELLKAKLYDFVSSKYGWKWLHDNQFSEKIIKIELLSDEYWFRIGRTRSGTPMRENFIWQNNQTETIKIS